MVRRVQHEKFDALLKCFICRIFVMRSQFLRDRATARQMRVACMLAMHIVMPLNDCGAKARDKCVQHEEKILRMRDRRAPRITMLVRGSRGPVHDRARIARERRMQTTETKSK
jgi:hypothetical protein